MTALLPAPVSHSAPGQYLGFSLQPVRMFFHLLNGKNGERVSLEYFDDVAVHRPDGSVLVEQAKSALSHNPLSDWSNDLWKTIANWLQAVQRGQLDINKTQFRLYVTPVNAPGGFCKALHEFNSEAQVEAFTADLRKKLKKSAKERGCLAHLQVFLNATDSQRFELVKRLEVESIDCDPVNAIRQLLTPTIPSNLIDTIAEAGIGMAKERADKLIRQGGHAILEVDAFRKEFQAFVQKNNMPGILSSFAPRPESSALAIALNERPNFIRQLQFVEIPDDQQMRAVSDFLRTSADKAIWAEKGIVYEGTFIDWDDGLIRRHSLIKSEVDDMNADKSEIIRGRTVYNRCSNLEIPLDGRDVPGHFVHGSFNALADGLLLGWHPQYQKLFDTGES